MDQRDTATEKKIENIFIDGTRGRLSSELQTKYWMDSKSDWHYPIHMNA